MRERLRHLKDEAWKHITEADNTGELDQIRVRYLGKKGELTGLLRSMGSLPPRGAA
jgi:phenylalanyl-tRNA synthetase alpha chain